MSTVIQLFVLMVSFTFIEGCWPSARTHKWWRRPLLVDLCAWMLHPVSIGLGIAGAVVLVKAIVERLPGQGIWLWILHLRTSVAGGRGWLQIAAAFLIADFLAYWMHRAYHRFPLLWSFHVVHHTSEELDWLSTSRLHPISQALDTAVVGFFLLLAGLPVAAVAAANLLIGAAALVVHANVRWTFGPIQHLIVSPLFHQWHHAHPEEEHGHDIGNYGAVLSIWDRLFGTWTLPVLRRPNRFGAEGAPPSTLLGLALHPLRVLPGFVWGGKKRESTAVFPERAAEISLENTVRELDRSRSKSPS